MTIIAQLSREHALVEAAVGALRTYVAERLDGRAGPADAERFATFFRVWVGEWHHDREEDVLFPALTEGLGLPADRGPVAAILAQHHDLAEALAHVLPLLGQDALGAADRQALDERSRRWAHGLWQHIDAEESVLFPESEARLRRGGYADLRGRGPTAAEEAAREDGERLVAAYPPRPDPTALRGDGCTACPSYGVDCDGLERAWWNEHEWYEADDHLG